MSDYKVIYWGENQSTKVQFEEFDKLPDFPVTACFVAAFDKSGKLAIAKPKRGWGLPGGHVEQGETPTECIKREAKEECGIELENLQLIGGWRAEKLRNTSENDAYPNIAYQLLFLGDIKNIENDFAKEHEVSERAFIDPHDFLNYHHNPENYAEIIEYIKRCR